VIEKPSGLAADLPSRSTDYFALNPPMPLAEDIDNVKAVPETRKPIRPMTAPAATREPEPTIVPQPLQREPSFTKKDSIHSRGYDPEELQIEDRVCIIVNGERCLGKVMYLGPLEDTPISELWVGIELERTCKEELIQYLRK
jgi:hypothetical protein